MPVTRMSLLTVFICAVPSFIPMLCILCGVSCTGAKAGSPPDAALGHIIGEPNVLDHVKDINAYMRLLESKTPRVKVFSIGKSEEGREMLAVAVSDEANIRNLKLLERAAAAKR